MRIDRLDIATTQGAVDLSLHPRLSVITGLPSEDRDRLAMELVSSIGVGRPGLGADVIAPDGRYIQIRRPLNGEAWVVDAVSGNDISHRFLRANIVDLLGSLGLSEGQAVQLLCLSRANLQPPADLVIDRLARLDQEALWNAAADLAEIELELSGLDEAARPPRPTSNPLPDHQAGEHRRLEHWRLEHRRSETFALAVTFILLAMIVATVSDPIVSIPFLVGSCAAAGASGWWWRCQADGPQNSDLHENGADRRTASADRQRRTQLVEKRQLAQDRWTATTGGRSVSLRWAVEHRPDIQRRRAALNTAQDHPDSVPSDSALTSPLEHLRRWIEQVTVLFPLGMPIVLIEPVIDLDDFDVIAALAMIHDAMRRHQVVLLTDDQRITGWAEGLSKEREAFLLTLDGTNPSETPTARYARTRGTA